MSKYLPAIMCAGQIYTGLTHAHALEQVPDKSANFYSGFADEFGVFYDENVLLKDEPVSSDLSHPFIFTTSQHLFISHECTTHGQMLLDLVVINEILKDKPRLNYDLALQNKEVYRRYLFKDCCLMGRLYKGIVSLYDSELVNELLPSLIENLLEINEIDKDWTITVNK